MEKRKLNYAYMGNGISVWEDGKNAAKGHISVNRQFTLNTDKDFSDENKEKIYKMITEGNMTFSNNSKDLGFLILNPIHTATKEYIHPVTEEVYKLSVEKVDGKEYVCFGRQIFSDNPSKFADIPQKIENPSNKKYELTKYEKEEYGTKLYRIRALKDFGNVKAGDLGGFVESENNLSQEGNCWIYETSKVCGNAHVSGNAKIVDSYVYDNAIISDSAVITKSIVSEKIKIKETARLNGSTVMGNGIIKGNSKVTAYISFNGLIDDDVVIRGSGVKIEGNNIEIRDKVLIEGQVKVQDNVLICGNAQILDKAIISGDCHIYGYCVISQEASVTGYAIVNETATVTGKSQVSGRSIVTEKAIIKDNASITDNTMVTDNAIISGNAKISDNAMVSLDAKISGDAIVKNNALVSECAQVKGKATICDFARVGGNAIITESATVCKNAVVGGNSIIKGISRIERTNQVKQIPEKINTQSLDLQNE